MTVSAFSSHDSNVLSLDLFRLRAGLGVEELSTGAGNTLPDWEAAAAKRLEALIRLDHGWDGHAAPPVSFHNAHFAFQMLQSICGDDAPAPAIVPGFDGDLQVEWQYGGVQIELHVLAANEVIAWRGSYDAEDEGEEVELENDFTTVERWVSELTSLFEADGRATA